MTAHHRDLPHNDSSLGFGSTADRRAQAQLEQKEQFAERQRQLAAQASPLSTPEERIRLWERLHALKLPTSADHQLVFVIARHTELSVAEVREEQRRRSAPRSATEIDSATI